MDLYFCKYNNYFNRVYKPKLTNLSDYETYKVGEVLNCNLWNPNDGVDAVQVLNYVGDIPDYLVVGNRTADTIDSVWFVIDANRTRNGQYKITLRRDLVAEHFNEIMNAPAYVEKGWADGDDSVVFNPENISVNQIKKRQDLLYDKSGCPWVVGFVKDGADIGKVSVPLRRSDYINPDRTVESIEDIPIYGRSIRTYAQRLYEWTYWAPNSSNVQWQGSTLPNCVGYVTGVWMDMVKYQQPGGSTTHPCPYIGNAGYWWQQAGAFTLQEIMSDPTLIEPGDILCFGLNNDPNAGTPQAWGHLAIVESVDLGSAASHVHTTNSYYGGAMYAQADYYFSNSLAFGNYYCQGIIKKPVSTYSGNFDGFSSIDAFSTYVQSNAYRKSYFTGTAYGGRSTCIVIQEDPVPSGSGYMRYYDAFDYTATDIAQLRHLPLEVTTNPPPPDVEYILQDGTTVNTGNGYQLTGDYLDVARKMLNTVPGLNLHYDREYPIYNSNQIQYYKDTYDNKVFYETSTNKFYRLSFKAGIPETEGGYVYRRDSDEVNRKIAILMGATMNESVSEGDLSGYACATSFRVSGIIDNYRLNVTEIEPTTYVEWTNYVLDDAPYSMFFFPLGALDVYDGDSYRWTTSKDLSLSVSRGLSKALSSNLMDLVVLPYCPVQNLIDTESYGGAAINQNVVDFLDLMDDTGTPVYSIYFANVSDFELPLVYETNIQKNFYKIRDICTKYRICSSNNANFFEFSPAKNHNVNTFTAHCTYKPFVPYVRIEPNFKYLYGGQYKDGRGLILSGDFSLPRSEDAWNNYLIQNKYFKDIFDRGTQNLNTMEGYNRIERGVGALTGAVSTGVTAGIISPTLGVAGGLLSAAGGVADMYLADKRFSEAKDYRQDLFSLNNQTVQALPDTLVKGNGWNIDSTFVPFVEFYECTEEEYEAVTNKLYYNGYTINRIGMFKDYLNPTNLTYIKGQIIHLMNVPDDFHYLNEISNEMYKGMFVRIPNT